MGKIRGDLRRCLGRNAAFPVVLVSTRDNFMTAAMAHYFCFEPPLIGVGLRPATHTFALIRAEKAFVVNVPTAEQVELVEAAGNVSGRDGDKFARLGLTRAAAAEIDSSLIAECPVNIECRLVRELDFPERTWFIGQALAIHEAEGYDSAQSLVYSDMTYHAVGQPLGRRRK